MFHRGSLWTPVVGDAYGMIKRLDAGKPRAETAGDPADTLERAHAYCNVTLYDLIDNLRHLMRQDLGISDSARSNQPILRIKQTTSQQA